MVQQRTKWSELSHLRAIAQVEGGQRGQAGQHRHVGQLLAKAQVEGGQRSQAGQPRHVGQLLAPAQVKQRKPNEPAQWRQSTESWIAVAIGPLPLKPGRDLANLLTTQGQDSEVRQFPNFWWDFRKPRVAQVEQGGLARFGGSNPPLRFEK